MYGEVLRAALRLAVLIFGLAVFMLPFQPRGSGEFVVTVLAAIVGGLFLLAIVGLSRWWSPPMPAVDDDRSRKALNDPSPTREGKDAL